MLPITVAGEDKEDGMQVGEERGVWVSGTGAAKRPPMVALWISVLLRGSDCGGTNRKDDDEEHDEGDENPELPRLWLLHSHGSNTGLKALLSLSSSHRQPTTETEAGLGTGESGGLWRELEDWVFIWGLGLLDANGGGEEVTIVTGIWQGAT